MANWHKNEKGRDKGKGKVDKGKGKGKHATDKGKAARTIIKVEKIRAVTKATLVPENNAMCAGSTATSQKTAGGR